MEMQPEAVSLSPIFFGGVTKILPQPKRRGTEEGECRRPRSRCGQGGTDKAKERRNRGGGTPSWPCPADLGFFWILVRFNTIYSDFCHLDASFLHSWYHQLGMGAASPAPPPSSPSSTQVRCWKREGSHLGGRLVARVALLLL